MSFRGNWFSVGTGTYMLRDAKPSVFVSGSRGLWRWRLVDPEIAGSSDTLREAQETAYNAFMTQIELPRRAAAKMQAELKEKLGF